MKTLRKGEDTGENTILVEEKFKEIADRCEHRFIDEEGLANCKYHESSVGYCSVDFCPKLEETDSP